MDSYVESMKALLPNTTSAPRYGSFDGAPWADMAVVAGELVAKLLSQRANVVEIGIRDIDKALRNLLPNLVICESAVNGSRGLWGNRLRAAYQANDHLTELVETAHLLGIPSVFWFTCSPEHVPGYLAAARLFDIVVVSNPGLMNDVSLALGREDILLGLVGEFEEKLSYFGEQSLNLARAQANTPGPLCDATLAESVEALKLVLDSGPRHRGPSTSGGSYISYLHVRDVDGLATAVVQALRQTVRPAAFMLSDSTVIRLGSAASNRMLESLGTLYVEGPLQAESAVAPVAVTFYQDVIYGPTYAEDILDCLRKTRAPVAGATEWRMSPAPHALRQPRTYKLQSELLPGALGTTDFEWLKQGVNKGPGPFDLLGRAAYSIAELDCAEMAPIFVQPAGRLRRDADRSI